MKGRIFSVLACAVLVACAVIEQFTNELSLTLAREDTAFAPEPVWVSGDAVKVLSATRKSGQSFSLSAGMRTASGTFRGEKPGSAPFLLLWPASAEGEYLSAASMRLQLPAVQSFDKDGYDASACPFAASADGSESVLLCTPMSVIELPVTGDAVLRALELSAPENHPLCGSAVLSLGAEPSLRFEEGASSALTLSCGGGVKLSKNAARFRFVLPPEALSEGAELTLTDAEGGVMRCVLEAAPLERGGLLELPAVEYEQQEPPYLNQRTPGLYTISSKGKAAAIYVYEACRDQIAWIEGADALEWRLQCLEDGKVLRVRLPLQLGTAFDAVFSAIGVPASPDGKLRFSPVKSEDGLEWLVDASGKTLLILNTAL